MPTLLVDHDVADYAAWRAVYDSADDARTQNGVISHRVYQDAANPNHVVVEHKFADAAAADAFLRNAELREALGRAGVVAESVRAVVVNDVS